MSDRSQAPGFGSELRRRRQAGGMGLRDLAAQIDFDFSYLAQEERGSRGGSPELASRCDEVLGAEGHLIQLYAAEQTG